MVALELAPAERRELIFIISLMFGAGFAAIVFPPYRVPMLIYTLLSGMAAVVYGLAGTVFNNIPFGLRFKKFGRQMFAGITAAAIFITVKIVFPAFAVSTIGPSYSVSSSITFIILLVFAPTIEEAVFRGALFAFIYWSANRKKNPKQITMRTWQFWVANTTQATAFMAFHALAYNQGWYNLPSAAAVATSFLAQSAPFIAAFTWGLVAGVIDDLAGGKEVGGSLIPGIVGHASINFLVFVSLSVVGTPFSIALPLSLISNSVLGFMLIPIMRKRNIKNFKMPYKAKSLKKDMMKYPTTEMPIFLNDNYTQIGGACSVFSPNDEKGDSVSEGETKFFGDLK